MAAALAKFIRDRKTTHGIQKLGLDDRIRSYMGMGEDITIKGKRCNGCCHSRGGSEPNVPERDKIRC